MLGAGVGLTDLGSEAMDIIKGLAGIVAAHYPERLYRCSPPCCSIYLCRLLYISCITLSQKLTFKEPDSLMDRVHGIFTLHCRNFIVNAPGFFSLVWRVAEPMLSPTTRRKIRLLHNKQVLLPNVTLVMLYTATLIACMPSWQKACPALSKCCLENGLPCKHAYLEHKASVMLLHVMWSQLGCLL